MTTQGKRFKKIRQALGLSQDDFASFFDATKSYISLLENDKSKLSVDNLIKLLLNYNVNLNYLLGGIGDMFIPAQFEQVQDDLVLRVREILRSEGVIK